MTLLVWSEVRRTVPITNSEGSRSSSIAARHAHQTASRTQVNGADLARTPASSPTPEQIGIVRRIQQGVSLIRGAAGSGKTSTALTALRASTGTTVDQFRNEGRLPANVLVLTYNNSLKGYITAVAEADRH